MGSVAPPESRRSGAETSLNESGGLPVSEVQLLHARLGVTLTR